MNQYCGYCSCYTGGMLTGCTSCADSIGIIAPMYCTNCGLHIGDVDTCPGCDTKRSTDAFPLIAAVATQVRQQLVEQGNSIQQTNFALGQTNMTLGQTNQHLSAVAASAAAMEKKMEQDAYEKEVKQQRLAELQKKLIGEPKDELQEAFYGNVATQFLKTVKEPIIAKLSASLSRDDDERASIANRIGAFLETELGDTLLRVVLAAILGAAPLPLPEQRLFIAKRLRVRGYEQLVETATDIFLDPLRDALVSALESMPSLSQQQQPATEETKPAQGLPQAAPTVLNGVNGSKVHEAAS